MTTYLTSRSAVALMLIISTPTLANNEPSIDSLTKAVSKLLVDINLLKSKQAGVIEAFAGTEVPDGYLLCDGREVSKSEYPNLYKRIGNAWNKFNNSANPTEGNFRVPNLVGLHLEGSSTPGRYLPQSVNPAGLKVSGTTSSGSNSKWVNNGVFPVAGGGNQWTNHAITRGNQLSGVRGNGTYPGQDHTHSFSANVTGPSSTTRPNSATVLYIIKY
ncbi:phage tail protein [Pseudobacteriovorax antillogorgiicola]|uniref:Phage Tail Collar Domain n=1 Tax=Pseudobacteriovorax antillogorgiicola TaxID=1513793 RepID=A0A1Y6B5M0_9BACT|nr:phage tail protein [Pseudobacteriovorax antillogorgiicola]TCS59109.1 tail collar domain [Pseudobacteriovorax antillogorgiicola]SME91729.1 Phage Tail Collar Domain [Pseudobacteriovorax antillogorgiicola]